MDLAGRVDNQWIGEIVARKQVIESARSARRELWKTTGNAGRGTKLAADVTRKWQEHVRALYPGCFEAEYPVPVGRENRIDLLDKRNGVAYELKVSPNNPHHEFFRDLFKIAAHNERTSFPVKEFVFIVPLDAGIKLENGLGGVAKRLSGQLGFTVTIEGI